MDPDDLANLNALIAAGRGQPPAPPSGQSQTDLLADALLAYGQPRSPSLEAQRREDLARALMNYRPKGAGQPAPPPSAQQAGGPISMGAGMPSEGPADGVARAGAAPMPYRATSLDVGDDSGPWPGAAAPGAPGVGGLIPVADVRLANRYPQGMPLNPRAPQSWDGPASPGRQPYTGGFQFGPGAGSDLPSRMSPSDDLVGFIKQRELGPNGGPALTPYGSIEKGTATIGWGHKIQSNDSFSHGISPEGAERLFSRDLDNARQVVSRSVHAPLTQGQFDALVSLAWNRPAAVRDLAAEINRGDYATAAQKFANYNTARHVPQPGLTERRGAEQDLFLTGIYDDRR